MARYIPPSNTIRDAESTSDPRDQLERVLLTPSDSIMNSGRKDKRFYSHSIITHPARVVSLLTVGRVVITEA